MVVLLLVVLVVERRRFSTHKHGAPHANMAMHALAFHDGTALNRCRSDAAITTRKPGVIPSVSGEGSIRLRTKRAKDVYGTVDGLLSPNAS